LKAMLAPLKRRDFSLLLSGQSISWIGNNFYEIAIMWLVLRLTGSTAAMAGVAAVSAVPQLIFAPLAGVVADRVNRRLLALAMDCGRGLTILVLPLLSLLHHLAVWQIYLVAFVLWTLFTFFIPARQSMIPNLVPDEELPAANAAFQAMMFACLLLGYAFGGLVVAAYGVVPALFFDSVTFVGSVSSLLLIRSSGRSVPRSSESHSALKETILGLQFIWHRANLLTVFVFSGVVGLLVGPLLILAAPFSRSVLHAGARGYGLLEGSLMLGGVVGALAASLTRRIQRVGWLLIAVCLVAGVLLTGMSFSTVLPVALPFYLGVGLASGVVNVPLATLIQRLTPDEMRGRVMSSMMMINTAGIPISVAIGGAVAQRIGVATMYAVEGALFLITGLVSMVTPLVRLRSGGEAGPEEATKATIPASEVA